ncbi:aldo/keto reductase [Rhizobium laguerreae]|uniref:aldo/keto reductase n=2 Tax=Rhizobium laguerreae TaxID=1076926 RepID=UPI002484C236|nr:aldo/keto reductase [Rhizobium laguerreae]
MMLQAWSPFQKGFFDGVFLGDSENFADLNGAMDELAKAYGVTPTGIAVAWITRHPANIQVVLGTTKPERVVEAAVGSSISMTARNGIASSELRDILCPNPHAMVAFANVAIKARLITVTGHRNHREDSADRRLDRVESSGPEKTLLPDTVGMSRLSIGNSMAPPIAAS